MRRATRSVKLKPLKDDFPRKLSRFEIEKIKTMMQRNLGAVKIDFENSTPGSTIPKPFPSGLSHKAELVYSNLDKWPVHVSLRSLREVDLEDERVDKFFENFFTQSFDQETIVQVIELLMTMNNTTRVSDRVSQLVTELVLNRRLEELPQDLLTVLAQAVNQFGASEQVLNTLVAHALSYYHVSSLLVLNAVTIRRKSEFIFPEILIPTLTKSELVDLLESVEPCEIPQVIAHTVDLVSNELSRLSFHRLVDDKDRVLKILFKLKLKLDQQIFIENNPFYSKEFKRNFLKFKIFKSISSNFHEQVLALPMPQVAQKMLLLNGVNSLKLESIDIVANRIQSFGDTLLANLSGTDFTCLLYAISHHPSAWKRKDKYRNQIATVVARALKDKLDILTQSQLVSCTQSIMLYHNSLIRTIISDSIIPRIDFAQISSVDDQTAIGRIMAKLSHDSDQACTGLLALFDALDFPRLTTPQTVDFFEICSSAKLVGPIGKLIEILQNRLEVSGGLISPSNVSRVLSSLAILQARNIDSLRNSLLQTIGDFNSLHPRLLARLVSDVALLNLSSPADDLSWAQGALLSLAVPENLNTIMSDGMVAKHFASSVPLLGETGQVYAEHLSQVPGNSLAGLLENAQLEQRPKIDKQEWSGLLPKSTSFVGDVLGALFESGPMDSETGGFIIETPRIWRNELKKIQITIVREKDCAKDDPRHILARAAREIAGDRSQGWQVIVLPETAIDGLLETCSQENLKRKIRRARIIHGNIPDDTDRLVRQLKEIFTDNN